LGLVFSAVFCALQREYTVEDESNAKLYIKEEIHIPSIYRKSDENGDE